MPYRHYGNWRARWIDHGGNQHSKNFDDFRSADYFEKRMKAKVEEVRRGLPSLSPEACARALFESQ